MSSFIKRIMLWVLSIFKKRPVRRVTFNDNPFYIHPRGIDFYYFQPHALDRHYAPPLRDKLF
jgi:hypothetical protein